MADDEKVKIELEVPKDQVRIEGVEPEEAEEKEGRPADESKKAQKQKLPTSRS